MAIEEIPSLEKFKLFRDDSNPNYHIIHYQIDMPLYSNNDVWMCKMFPPTPKGSVMRWYSKFPTISINYFETFADIVICENIKKPCSEWSCTLRKKKLRNKMIGWPPWSSSKGCMSIPHPFS
ncbi:hypothetical protein DVH24_021525 [Malus domestica]|uniref:Retrotransposon gag domain-containing protein n=1 Tax=Malus domestica TaxID=3750 RepID=A0A498K0B3_MALDO|nr:hypothetical protein DVH24_021525 [Malus domestica]